MTVSDKMIEPVADIVGDEYTKGAYGDCPAYKEEKKEAAQAVVNAAWTEFDDDSIIADKAPSGHDWFMMYGSGRLMQGSFKRNYWRVMGVYRYADPNDLMFKDGQ